MIDDSAQRLEKKTPKNPSLSQYGSNAVERDKIDHAGNSIATDKMGYPHNVFLISRQKHMLWVLIRSSLPRRF